jgi:MoCo/4Fe-4S cofactor protein with predicted Tat translocation signal
MKNDTTRKYWRSHDELLQTSAYQEELQHEFQDDLDVSTPEPEGTSRRDFLGWVSTSLAASGLIGCDVIRRPVDKILPYSKATEELLPGIAQYYASAINVAGQVAGVLVESHEGRPTKVEGNPLFQNNLGGLNSFQHSSIFDLYDPQRLRVTRHNGKTLTIEEANKVVSERGAKLKADSKKVVVLAESMPSVQIDHLRTQLKTDLAGAEWFTYESVSDDHQSEGLKAVFGERLNPRYHFKDAKVVLSIDNDFLMTEGPSVAYARDWSEGRKVKSVEEAEISRLYIVEARYSLTGTNADHRVRAKHAEIEAFAYTVAKEFGITAPSSSVKLSKFQSEAAAAIVKDLKANQGSSLVVAGRNQPAAVHAVVAVLNEKLGATKNHLVKYYPDVRRAKDALGDMDNIKAVHKLLTSGSVGSIVILGGNPVYSAPSDLDFKSALAKAEQVIYLSDQDNETTAALDTKKSLIIPRAHAFECWNDWIGVDGQIALQQPMIQPLHGAMSDLELLAQLLGNTETTSYKILRKSWREKAGAVGFNKRWRAWLHSGIVDEQFRALQASTTPASSIGSLTGSGMGASKEGSFDLLFIAGSHTFDGRFINNPLLQELPDPLTKITWDNAALISPRTAEDMGISDEDMVKVSVQGKNIETVAWVMPGQADHTLVLSLGYGRKFKNYLPYHLGSYNEREEVGFDVNPLRTADKAFVVGGGTVSKTGETYDVAAIQRYANSRQEPGFGFDARPLVRENTVEGFKKTPTFATPGIIKHGEKMPDVKKHALLHPPEESIFPDYDYSKGHQWGLVIDLNTCIGCNACVVACNIENNVSMVGKDQVRRGREMHWMRMDRYFVGSKEDPQIVHQPIACQQCETAPCENVCPVAATVHSPEGLNDMVYNRCIGTRYCANNCPFKVRRFNFYNYAKGQDELVHMHRNPNVTVRFRGVMEKCTYCVQRINKGKRNAALNPEFSRQIINSIVTACGQSCPTGGIAFGDLNDPESEVSKVKKDPRNYRLLSELNVQARTSYLAKIRNPNPNFPKLPTVKG